MRNTSTAMSRTIVLAFSGSTDRCGHATSAINGSADAQSCMMIGHLNHGSGVPRKTSSVAQTI